MNIVHNQFFMERLQSSFPIQSSDKLNSSANSLTETSNKEDFFNTLQSSISTLEHKQLDADYGIQGLITGEADSLHEVMIKTTEAQISLEMAVQLRNKCLEAMNEIKNMQF